jgi:hypothetical protein
VLRLGHTIYFESGTIHFVFRLQGTQMLMFGGHVLRWSRIPLWIDVLRKQLSSPDTPNEDLPPQLVRTYVDAVAQLVEDRAGRAMNSGIADTFLSLKIVGTPTRMHASNMLTRARSCTGIPNYLDQSEREGSQRRASKSSNLLFDFI